MKYLPLVWAGLWRKQARTALTLCSIAIAFVLIGVLTGVDASFAHNLAIARLDRLYVTSPVPMPLSYTDQIARVHGVSLIVPHSFINGYFQNPTQRVGVQATNDGLFAARPNLTITREQLRTLRQMRTGAIVNNTMADKYGWRVGDKTPIYATNVTQADGSHVLTFNILGIIRDSDRPQSNWFVANYEYLDQARTSDKGTVDVFLIRIDAPDHASQISSQIDQLFESSAVPTRTSSEKALQQQGLQSLGDAKSFTHTIVGAVLFMLLFITGSVMMQSIRERGPEFAMLKAIGFSDVSVLAFLTSESVLLCAFAAVIGLLVSKLLILIVRTPPYTFFLFQPSWAVTLSASGLALIIALASVLPPAWRVQRVTIVDALAGR